MQVGPLSRANPAQTVVLMVESVAHGAQRPYHKQKLALIYSAMRHFRLALEAGGFTVSYQACETWAEGIAAHLKTYPNAPLELMQPADFGVAAHLGEIVTAHGGRLEVVENELWLSSDADWQRFSKGKKQLRMEFFYRQMRQQTGWLMIAGEPIGGQFNFDSENRQPPPKDHAFPPKLEFLPDQLTRQTIDWVMERFPDHFGTLEAFNWPVTREDALTVLEHFLVHRLDDFGGVRRVATRYGVRAPPAPRPGCGAGPPA